MVDPGGRLRGNVAAVVERDGRFHLVEEHTTARLRLNNPAGHPGPAGATRPGCCTPTRACTRAPRSAPRD